MKKILTYISVLIATGTLLTAPAYAMRLSPNTGTFAPLSEQTIAIVASPTMANAKGVQIRLTVTNATIVPDSYSVSSAQSQGYLSIGLCPGSIFATSTQVCVDAVRTNDADGNERFVTEGNLLGEFRIKFNAGVTSATIVTGTDSAYLVGSNLVYNNGQTLGTYTVGTPATPTLPVTGLGDSPVLMIMAGVGIVSLGILFLVWREKLQNSYK